MSAKFYPYLRGGVDLVGRIARSLRFDGRSGIKPMPGFVPI